MRTINIIGDTSVVNQPVRLSTELGVRSKELGRYNNILTPNNRKAMSIEFTTDSRRRAQKIAQYLADKLQSPEHLPFFYKVAWRLSPDIIGRLVEVSAVARNRRAYFIACAKAAMR